MATFKRPALSTTGSLKLSKQSQAVLQSPLRSKQMLYWSRQETKTSKIAAWGSRQCRACSAHAPLSELCKTSQRPPWRAATTQALLLAIGWQNGHIFTYRWDLGCRAVVIFSLGEPSDAGWEASHFNLHARLKAELNCTVFMKHCREENQ